MAATRSPGKPPSVVKVVLWGILTGLAVWQPIVWWDLLPPQAPIGEPMAADDGGGLVNSPAQSWEGRPKFPIRVFDDPPLIASKPSLPKDAATPKAATPGVRSEPTNHSGSSSPQDLQIPALQSIDPDAAPLKLEPPSLPAASHGNHSASVRGGAGMPTGQASLRLQQPQPVAVVNYETPVFETTVASDDESGTLRLMHELNDMSEEIAAAAREALMQRGFQENHLQLAKQFTSNDATKRARLAAQLPTVSGIDARLWLTWLMRDEVADVRLAALSVLATGSDPETLSRVITIGRQDSDARIRAQAEQLDKARRVVR
jgi:hypothetical protein